ncbi:hypothetical protein DFQ27_003072 [Actinomortierella ambigua]|uniref:FAD/NAD(P)-binding domain-containing protein n=1 Tax=Actinomortierella ambigua TaxID=1343610 RepID=A0A9P6Q7N3_9FUNG|nr:hypothetical protein DFQ27_003072 [Actinomortierella ambigua]
MTTDNIVEPAAAIPAATDATPAESTILTNAPVLTDDKVVAETLKDASTGDHKEATFSKEAAAVPKDQQKNVVIIGGSCCAVSSMLTAKTILPKTHRLIVIEKHSHFHYMFAFPRATVISGWENELFVPYTKMFESPEKGEVVQALAVSMTKTHVQLDREVPGFGNQIEYEYLIYATGSRHPEPGNLNDCDTKESAIARLREYQEKIKKSTKVLIVGGGAVGMELATEIREHFPEKEVTLVHSRDRYMPIYLPTMSKKCFKTMEKFGVKQIMGDRVIIPEGGFKDDFQMIKVKTKNGLEIECDYQVLCTGMTPQSDVLKTLAPKAVDPKTGLVMCKPTLQIEDDEFPNIYTCGDVANLNVMKTGGAAWGQADLCVRNIAKMIDSKKKSDASGKQVLHEKLGKYKPIAPQIMLYFGVAWGICQLKLFGFLFATDWKFLIGRFFSYNIHATRAWLWLNTPMSKETADL